jgi:uncharacterized membrane protein
MTAAQPVQESREPAWPKLVLLLGIVAFGIFQVFLSWHRLHSLLAQTMDLGDFEQSMWKISHGDWWAFATVFQTPELAVDGFVWLYPLAYAFRFLGGPLVLFVVQAMGTALASYGLYHVARLRAWTPGTAVAIALIFLCYPAVIGASQYDFHPDFIALPAIIWAYAAYTEKRMPAACVWLLVAALSKNMVLISIAGWGIGLVLYRRQWREGLALIAGSLLLLAAEFLWIFPTYLNHGTVAITVTMYGYLGTSMLSVMTGLVTHLPTVAHHAAREGGYFFKVLVPVLGMAIAGAESVPAFLSLLAMNAVSAFRPQQSMDSQYQLVLGGWMFLALIEALSRWPRRLRLLLEAIATSCLLFELAFVSVHTIPVLRTSTEPYAQAIRLAREVPLTSVVLASHDLGPLVYRARLLGVPTVQVPGVVVDTLPVLWREGRAIHVTRTTLFGKLPVSPYFGAVIGEALRAGYALRAHDGAFFLVEGTRQFSPSPMFFYGYQPASSQWSLPAWTQEDRTAYVNWSRLLVEVGPHHPGEILGPRPIILAPGTYQIILTLVPDRRAASDPVGTFSAGTRQVLFSASSRRVSVRVTARQYEVLPLSVRSAGTGGFAIGSIAVHTIGTNAMPQAKS